MLSHLPKVMSVSDDSDSVVSYDSIAEAFGYLDHAENFVDPRVRSPGREPVRSRTPSPEKYSRDNTPSDKKRSKRNKKKGDSKGVSTTEENEKSSRRSKKKDSSNEKKTESTSEEKTSSTEEKTSNTEEKNSEEIVTMHSEEDHKSMEIKLEMKRHIALTFMEEEALNQKRVYDADLEYESDEDPDTILEKPQYLHTATSTEKYNDGKNPDEDVQNIMAEIRAEANRVAEMENISPEVQAALLDIDMRNKEASIHVEYSASTGESTPTSISLPSTAPSSAIPSQRDIKEEKEKKEEPVVIAPSLDTSMETTSLDLVEGSLLSDKRPGTKSVRFEDSLATAEDSMVDGTVEAKDSTIDVKLGSAMESSIVSDTKNTIDGNSMMDSGPDTLTNTTSKNGKKCGRCKKVVEVDLEIALFCPNCGYKLRKARKDKDIVTSNTPQNLLDFQHHKKMIEKHREEIALLRHGPSALEDNDDTREEEQEDLQELPPKLVKGLNTLLDHLNDPEVQHKKVESLAFEESKVMSLELESAINIEEMYMNINKEGVMGHNEDKVSVISAPTIGKPDSPINKVTMVPNTIFADELQKTEFNSTLTGSGSYIDTSGSIFDIGASQSISYDTPLYSESIYNTRPKGLAAIQDQYKEINRTLPSLVFGSTKMRSSVEMPPYCRPKKTSVAWKRDSLETLALQKTYQVVKKKGIQQQHSVPIKPSGTVVTEKPWSAPKPTDPAYLGDAESDYQILSRVKKPQKTYSYVTNYLDDVGSVLEYYERVMQRDSELKGVTRALKGSTSTTKTFKKDKYGLPVKNIKKRTLAGFRDSISDTDSHPVTGVAGGTFFDEEEMMEAEANIDALFDNALIMGDIKNSKQRKETKGDTNKTNTTSDSTNSNNLDATGMNTDNMQSISEDQDPEATFYNPNKDKDYTEGGKKSFFWGPLREKERYFLPKEEDPHGFLALYGENIDDNDIDMDMLDEEELRIREENERSLMDVEEERMIAFLKEEVESKKKKVFSYTDGWLDPSDSDKEDEKEPTPEKPTSPRLLDPVIRTFTEQDNVDYTTQPMLWTHIIQPNGPTSFDQDVREGLERPLTPEPTSDDEDAAFEAELEKMKAKKSKKNGDKEKKDDKESEEKQGGEEITSEKGETETENMKDEKVKEAPVSTENEQEGDETETKQNKESKVDEAEMVVSFATGDVSDAEEADEDEYDEDYEDSVKEIKSMESPPAVKSQKQLELEEMEAKKRREAEAEAELIVPDKVIEAKRLERKKYIAAMRRNVRFTGVYDPDPEDALDEKTGLLKSTNKNAVLEPIYIHNPDKDMYHEDAKKMNTYLPDEKGHAIMSRLYKASTKKLKECVKEPNKIRLIDELLPITAPRSFAHEKVALYKEQQIVVKRALDYARVADATARKEHTAYQTLLSKRRAKAATTVSDALHRVSEYQQKYEKKYDELIEKLQKAPDTRKDKIKAQINRVSNVMGSELKELGEKVVDAQKEEEREVSECRGLEETCVRIFKHWRPLNASLFEEAKLVNFRLQALIEILSVRIIQRTARKRLLMYCRGEPDDNFADMLLNKMKTKKKVVYGVRPW